MFWWLETQMGEIQVANFTKAEYYYKSVLISFLLKEKKKPHKPPPPHTDSYYKNLQV